MTSLPAEAAAPLFSRKTVIVMVLAGIFSFSALAVLASFAPDLRRGGDPRAHALSKSAVGFGGLVELLQMQGAQVTVSRTRASPANPAALVILTPGAEVSADDIHDLVRTNTLVILPKWEIAPHPRNRDWVTRAGLVSPRAIAAGPGRLVRSVAVKQSDAAAPVALVRAAGGAQMGRAEIANLQTISGADLVPLVTDANGSVVLGRVGERPLYILSDPDLLNTHGLRSLEGARTGLAVLDEVRRGPVVFDVTLNGYERGRSVWKLALQPPFLGATLCVFAAAVLMGLHASVRFGAARHEQRAIGMGKRALADNQADLIRMAKRDHRMAVPYARLIRDRTAKAIGAQAADEPALEAALDRLSARRTAESISALMTDAGQVADRAGLMRLARRLHQWKLEITRERQ